MYEEELRTLVLLIRGERLPYPASGEETAYNFGLERAVVIIRREIRRLTTACIGLAGQPAPEADKSDSPDSQ